MRSNLLIVCGMLILTMMSLTACVLEDGNLPVEQGDSPAPADASSVAKDNAPVRIVTPAVNVSSSLPQDMTVFEGKVFVASTEPLISEWNSAGWRISDQPLDTDSDDVPLDCTLYPHKGVANQWVGGCTGYVLVPRDGAAHIAVVYTDQFSSTTMVQVAPQPESP